MNRKLFLPAVAVVCATGLSLAQGNRRAPYIVVLEDNTRFEDFRAFDAPDERDRADPQGWGYLDRGVSGTVRYLEQRGGFKSHKVFSHAIRGFAADLTGEQVEQLKLDRLVARVEPDGVMTASAQVLPWGVNRVEADISSTLAGNGSGAVTNVNVYVIDTGVATHPDLYRVAHVNFVAGSTNTDCNGHGTHVAGTVAARDNASDVVGVAPGAPVTGVKVLDCNGSGFTSGVIKGVDWVTANRKLPAVANMSLGGGASQALDDAVRRSVTAGVFYAVAAGNSGANACTQSPARAGAGSNNGILTVAATDSANQDPSWSNYGSCVDIWAPGVSVVSTRLGGGTASMSGTSMASPHGAGGAALYRARSPYATPAQVESVLRNDARATGTVSNGGQAIKLLFVGLY